MPQGLPSDPPRAAPPPPAAALRPRTGWAWLLVALAFLAVQGMHLVEPEDTEDSRRLALEVMRQQVQQQYGAARMVEGFTGPAPGLDAASRLEAFRPLGTGPVPHRQRYAVLAGDLAGPARAREILGETERLLRERDRVLEGTERRVQEALHRLYSGDGPAGDPAALEPGEEALLRKELGWFGDLALAPPGDPESEERRAVLDPAQRVAVRLLVLFGGMVAALGAGLLAGIVFLVLLANGSVRMRFATGGGAPGGIHAETFAAWLLLFLGLQLGTGLLFGALAPEAGILLPSALSFLLSFAALGWPVLRGVPFARVREDLGLVLSPTPFRDALAGAACWLMALPVVAVAFLVSLFLILLQGALKGEAADPFAPVSMPTHPVMGEISGGTAWIGVLLVASVLAPLAEETFFRGVLYRHLREATGRRSRAPSVALSATASGLLFAAIHPQGWAFVPVLFAVAWGMVHAREWRDSLVAPVVAHGLHNAAVMTVAFTAFGG